MAFTAFLDGCVLIPAGLRDTLLRLAHVGLYRVRWSADVLDEVRRNLAELNKAIPLDRIDSLLSTMTSAFEDALVEGYEYLIDAMTNDPKDRHVLAAASVGRADVIVTLNVKDFPGEATRPHGIEVQTPDEFLLHAFHLDPDLVARVLREQADALVKPPMTVDEVLESLGRVVPNFVKAMSVVL